MYSADFAESDQYGCAGCARRCGGTRNAGKRSDAAYGRFYMVFKELASRKTSDNIEDVLDVSTENMMQLKEESG